MTSDIGVISHIDLSLDECYLHHFNLNKIRYPDNLEQVWQAHIFSFVCLGRNMK